MKAIALLILIVVALHTGDDVSVQSSSVSGKKICIDAGHGGTAKTDSYRVGANGEREEWINLRVALLLKKMLEEKGATVIMTRNADVIVDLESRAKMAVDNKADVFISIHHNATADTAVNFPIVYFHGAASENQAGVQLATVVATAFVREMYRRETPLSVVSDYTIFPKKGAGVLRNSYGVPGILAEASFFTNQTEESRLKQYDHNRREAYAYLVALEQFFLKPALPILTKKIPFIIPPFEVFQEADRMKPEALRWEEDYYEALKLMKRKDSGSLQKAYDLFTRSARSVPDSWLARECHLNRASLLSIFHRSEEARFERMRAEEFYTPHTFQKDQIVW